MIQATELRLGNYVNLNDGSEHDKIRQISGIEHKIVYTLIKGCRFAQVHQSFDRIYPIPLTEEIIIKCGFERSEYNDYRHPILFGTLTLYEGVAELHISDMYSVWVNNLHQLQNLYFALTGEELEVKI
ncbi:hypothetical protein BC792_12740 [Sphingobacterium allocomposti]|uniref:Uncharacterized protein n=1 Tax=Sphingobacterium allocomposti TaxID=415956 RepID=A0A5S5D445_9SPHI|nr:hypothetical protein [Sphingobacterium composti Yoo et al. 2007 non Ten et al. 2007]TYP89439.1 hypothetical protein BC792_12740 [Sphingobacterium composti Yoo et al. 2007 non Ten et al. 2007]